MKKCFALLLALLLAFSMTAVLAEDMPFGADGGGAPKMPQRSGDGDKPDAPPDGKSPGTPPGNGGPGGGSVQPESYLSAYTYAEDTEITGGNFDSTGTDENAILVEGEGTVTLDGATITRVSADSTGGDTSSFYGVGAAALVTSGVLRIANADIDTDASGGAGVFAYGEGVAYATDTTITTSDDTSGGIHVAGGGTLYAADLTVETSGESSAAIRSDRGSGTMVVDGGSYTTTGTGSPAVYVTADITIHDAVLTATGSEALCLEGKNVVRLYDSALTGNMADLDQNDNTWTVILYQSMSGDSEIGEGKIEMVGGTLTAQNGGLFYTTNTKSEFILSGVSINAAADSEYFLRCTGNANQRGWGTSGDNGADCRFTAIGQQMDGDILWDSISTLDLYATQNSTLTGAILNDESYAGDGGNGYANLYIDENSQWIVTGDSVLTALYCTGTIADAEGKTVSITGVDGTAFVEGDSQYTITVADYSTESDLSNVGVASEWSDYAVEMG